jgi:membrane dipeptidase
MRVRPSAPIALGALLAVLLGAGLAGFALARQEADPAETVRAVLERVPLVDGHNDVPWQYRSRADNHLDRIDFRDTTALDPVMHTDLARLRASGIGGQFWSVYVPASFSGPAATVAVLEQIDVVHRMVETYPESLELALSAEDVVRIHAAGRVASLIGMEGGHAIAGSLATLRQLYAAGARYMTLTHSANNEWADASTDDPEHGGLSAFGVRVVREMNRLGMLVDLSHVAASTMHDTLDVAEAPVIFSHSSAFALTRHARNVPDDVLARLPANGGVVMITFVPPFVSEPVRQHFAARDAERKRLQATLSDEDAARRLATWDAAHPEPSSTLAEVADHIDHVRKTIGVAHVGLGSDYDGIESTPVGLEDVTKIPDLLAELARRGYNAADLEAVAGGNLLRAFREAERVAWRLQRERPADDTLRSETERAETQASGRGGR